MASDVILRIKVLTDASQAALGLDKAESAGGKFGNAMKKAALPAAAAGAAVVAFGKKAADAASKLQQSQGATEAVFGNQAKAVQKAADSAARTMGLSAADYNNYAALVGTALQNAGMSVEDSVKASNDVMQRGADLSALYGGTTADAVEAINAAVSRSEFDPLEKYGVSLSQAAINAELAKTGQDKLTGAALDTAKKQAALKLVFEKSGKAAGQYGREADSAAGQQQSMNAEMENAAAAIGQVLLPVVAAAAGALGDLAKWAQKNTTVVQILAGAILLIAAAVLAVNVALKIYQATMIVIQAVQKATWLTNPIGLVVVAIMLVVAAVILLWKKSETFRTVVIAVWNAIKTAALAVWNVIKIAGSLAFKALTLYVRAYVAVFKAIFTAIRVVAQAVWNAISAGAKAVGRVISAAFNAARSAARAAVDAIKSAWQTVTRTVEAVADKIRNALSKAFDAAKRAAQGVGNALSAPFDTIKGAVEGVIGAVKSLIGWLGKIKVPKISLPKIPGLGRSAAVPSSAALAESPTARGLTATPTALRSSASSSGVTIVVQGALDPEGVARQIRRILSGHGQRVGIARTGTVVV